ncbi:MAG: glycosyltransferase [Ectopseudomonas guguanensis]|uniref:glycosyltransferase family protein n=1 Tax=Ectopseudomonas guguanensis TaxID=1198456 RepID=UPI00391DC9FB
MIKQQLSLDGASYSIYLPDAESDYIQGRIVTDQQPYELEMLRDMAARLQPGDLVLDIGANIGNHSLYLASVAGCQVYAFSFQPENCSALVESVESNQLVGLVEVSTEYPDLSQYERLAAVLIGSIPSQEFWDALIASLSRFDYPYIYVTDRCVEDFSRFSKALVSQGYCERQQGSGLAFFSQAYLDIVEGNFSPFSDSASIGRKSDKNHSETEKTAADIKKLKNNLLESNLKYRKVLEQLNDLAKKHEVANLKYRDVTAQVAALKSEISMLEIKSKEQKAEYECLVGKHGLELEKAWFSLEKEKTANTLSEERWALYKERTGNELGRLSRRFAEAEAELVSVQAELSKRSQLLDQANEKYRQITAEAEATVGKLNESLQHSESEREELKRLLQSLQQQLNVANQKYRQATGQEIPQLKQQLNEHVKRARTLQERTEQLNRELKQARQEKTDAQRALSVLRSSLTYKAGMHLRAARISLKDAIKLPVRLWRLRQHIRPARNVPSHVELLPPPTADEHAALLVDNLADKANSQVRMACIMDDFTFGSYQPECQLFQLTPANWKAELEAFRPEVLFIESAWRGKDELWGSKVGHCSQELQGIVAWCRERHVPTVFWNKEDPVHFETFLTTAQLFDFVFTTDMDCIHRYKAALGHDHVYFLPFACQPAVHNPIEKYVRKDAFCFAGAYYVRYPERTRDLESFVRELPAFRPLEIYDRNFGKNDPNYQFPPAYQAHIVGTLPYSEIDKAYKGYRFAINLNSIKQSQSMFARRVYELLGSNTLTISNYSRGVRLMFGDLVLTSDSGSEIRRRLESLEGSNQIDRLRLAGLRKVMTEHTYADRLNYLLEKITGQPRQLQLPAFTVVARAYSLPEVEAVVANVSRQYGVRVELALVCGEKLSLAEVETVIAKSGLASRARALSYKVVRKQSLQELAGESWVAGMLAEDYYGPHYLLDMALATRYSDARVIGKAAFFFKEQDGGVQQCAPEKAYQMTQRLAARRSVIHPVSAAALRVKDWLRALDGWEYDVAAQLAIDSFNYCQGAGSQPPAEVNARVDDLPVSGGMSLMDLTTTAEDIAPLRRDLEHAPWLDGNQLGHLLQGKAFFWLNGHGLADSKDEERDIKLTRNPSITTRVRGPLLEIDSQLPDGKHEYVYASRDMLLQDLQTQLGERSAKDIPLHLQIDPGLNVSLVVLYLDAAKERLGHHVLQANRNLSVSPPEGTAFIRLGLRIYAGGSTRLQRLVLGHLDLEPANILGQSDVLLLTNHYPSYDDLYRNGFVHSRMKAYREHKVAVDVFRLRKDQPISWHEFQDIDVTTGSQQALRRLLAGGRYRHVLVHFLAPDMWDVLKDFIDTIKVTVWVHGAEVQPWWRREYNYQDEAELEKAKAESDERLRFWRALFEDLPANLSYVFVSKYFADEVIEDVGVELPLSCYEIIHNPVDTELFSYVEKEVEQRKSVLSIRPYASRKYANDLSVKAVLELSKESFFDQLKFKFVGDGELFDSVLEPLKGFANVEIQRGFLSQDEISRLHKEYGIFLCPTRMDAQGVSKDEAMASGLIPVTNGVTAIPEFVDCHCGILAAAEDYKAMAEGIRYIYLDPEKFRSMSQAAAARARRQVAKEHIIMKEISIFGVGS